MFDLQIIHVNHFRSVQCQIYLIFYNTTVLQVTVKTDITVDDFYLKHIWSTSNVKNKKMQFSCFCLCTHCTGNDINASLSGKYAPASVNFD